MFEISHTQRPMYFGDKQGVGQAGLLTGSVVLPRRIPLEELQRAANEVFRLNGGLRTRFIEKDGKVYQEYKPFEERTFEVKRFESKEALDAWAQVYATIPLKLDIRSEGEGVPKSVWKSVKPSAELVKNVAVHETKMFFTKLRYGMLRREPACCEIILAELPEASGAIIKMHHVISDAWTVVLVANQFLKILNGESPQAYSYEEFIESDAQYKQSRRFEKDQAFMEKWLEKCPRPTWVWPKPYTSLEASRRTVTLDEDMTRQVREYAADRGYTPYMLFLTAMCVYMSRKMQREMFYVGSVVINRAGYREKNTTGMFVHGAPLLMEIREEDSFADTIVNVRDTYFSGVRHQRGYVTPADTRDFLYDVWVSFQDASLEADPTAECTQYYCNYVIDTTILSIEDRAGEGRFKLHFDHNCKVSEADVDELFRTVLGVMRDGMADDSRPLRELSR